MVTLQSYRSFFSLQQESSLCADENLFDLILLRRMKAFQVIVSNSDTFKQFNLNVLLYLR